MNESHGKPAVTPAPSAVDAYTQSVSLLRLLRTSMTTDTMLTQVLGVSLLLVLTVLLVWLLQRRRRCGVAYAVSTAEPQGWWERRGMPGVWLLHMLRRLFTRRRRRCGVLLVGVTSCGKTALFTRLVSGDCTADTRTSMQANMGTLHPCFMASSSNSDDDNSDSSRRRAHKAVACVPITDYPGHRRLREGVYAHLATAADVVLVVDAVTIGDDRDVGAVAVAELLVSLLQSPCFVGVRRLCVACTRRDVVTSYSAKAVRVLLERAVAQVLASRSRELAAVDAVRDANGGVIAAPAATAAAAAQQAKNGSSSSGGGLLPRGHDDGFNFDQLAPLSVRFVDISNFPDGDEGDGGNGGKGGGGNETSATTTRPRRHPYNVTPVVDFILQRDASNTR